MNPFFTKTLLFQFQSKTGITWIATLTKEPEWISGSPRERRSFRRDFTPFPNTTKPDIDIRYAVSDSSTRDGKF